jgi:SnoaL-like domain
MSSIPRFAAYAAAFEKAYASDDWSIVEPFFTEDSVYDVGLPELLGGRIEGRAAILAYFKRVLDGFDRRFASRAVELLEGPREDGHSVWIRGRAVYTSASAPDLSFDLEEIASFEGDRICRLEDRYDDANRESLAKFFEAHGAALGIVMP